LIGFLSQKTILASIHSGIRLDAMSSVSSPLVIERRIEFSQTDAAGITHFSTYFTLMEAAEAELFRELGLSLLWQDKDGYFGFPRVDCQCKFRRPLKFDEKVRIELEIEEIDSKRIHYRFAFLKENGQRCATGTMVTACAKRAENGEIIGVDLPEHIRLPLLSWKNPVH
jgi:YbgC/YbaW family acyl-CoA thioester hydrolase